MREHGPRERRVLHHRLLEEGAGLPWSRFWSLYVALSTEPGLAIMARVAAWLPANFWQMTAAFVAHGRGLRGPRGA